MERLLKTFLSGRCRSPFWVHCGSFGVGGPGLLETGFQSSSLEPSTISGYPRVLDSPCSYLSIGVEIVGRIQSSYLPLDLTLTVETWPISLIGRCGGPGSRRESSPIIAPPQLPRTKSLIQSGDRNPMWLPSHNATGGIRTFKRSWLGCPIVLRFGERC